MTFIIGTPFTHNAGYHHNGAGREKEENDVQTCPHCEAVILMQQWRKVEQGKMTGGFCMKCSKPVCGRCNKKMQTHGCVPFLKELERATDANVKFARYLKDAGLEPVAPRPIFTGLIQE